MTSDRINMKETDESVPEVQSTEFAAESQTLLASRPAEDFRQSAERVSTGAAAGILNGFSLAESGSDSTTPGGQRPNDRTATGDRPNELPAPSREGEQREKQLGDVFKQLIGDLMKGPLGPIIQEVGRQLTSGQFDFDKLQSMAKNINIDEQQLSQLSKTFNEFSEALRAKTGIDIQANFQGKPGGKIGLKNIRMAEAGGNHNFNASLTIPAEGSATANSTFIAGYTGPSVTEITPAAAAAQIRNSALDARYADRR